MLTMNHGTTVFLTVSRYQLKIDSSVTVLLNLVSRIKNYS